MLHQETKDYLVLPLEFQVIVYNRVACDLDAFPCHEEIRWLLAWLHILVVPQVLEMKLLVVVLLLLVDVEVGAVEIEQTVRQLVARERPDNQLAFVAVKYTTAWEVTFPWTRHKLSIDVVISSCCTSSSAFWSHTFFLRLTLASLSCLLLASRLK